MMLQALFVAAHVIYPLNLRNSTASLRVIMGGMTHAPQDPTLATWMSLQERLAGYLAARARGLLASDFVLSGREGEELGRLRVHGRRGADIEARDITAAIKHGAGSRYTMLESDGRVILEETAGSGDASEVRRGDCVYEVRLALLRNAAVARSTGGSEVARVAGGLTNRSYEAFFDAGEEGALLLAVFLLYRIIALRRQAFLMGTERGDASSP
jgi:hypothetical protein